MGYQLTSLGNLPIEEDVTLYIFVINGNWLGGRYDVLEQNFSEIARAIGPNAVIAKGFEESLWSEELCQKYLGRDYSELFDLLPALLLAEDHPETLEEGSLRLLISLKNAEDEFGDLESFFRALTRFARDRDATFLDRFKDQRDWLQEGNSIIDLKPNFFGIGVNLNEFIRKIRSRFA